MGSGKAIRKDKNHAAYGDLGGGQGQIDAQRALLAAMTIGTSEIKTGGGQYNDEVLADSLFPKTVNDMALHDRQAAREDADAKLRAEADASKPTPPPDPSSKLTQQAQRAAMLRVRALASSRKSALVTGDPFGLKK